MIHNHSKLNLLGTEGRVGRAIYFLFSFIIPAGVFWFISALTGQLHGNSIINGKTAYIFILLAALLALLMLIRLTIQRSHDFNQSGWLSLLLLVFPPAILFFWLIPGSEDINDFGEPAEPLPTGMKILSPLLFVGLLAPTIYLVNRYVDFPSTISSFNGLFN